MSIWNKASTKASRAGWDTVYGRKCPTCGAKMERRTRWNAELKAAVPGWYCTECPESIHSGEDMQAAE